MGLVNRVAPQHWPLPAPAGPTDGWKAGRKGGEMNLRSEKDWIQFKSKIWTRDKSMTLYCMGDPVRKVRNKRKLGIIKLISPWWAWWILCEVRMGRRRVNGGYQRTTGPPAGHSVIHKMRPFYRPPSTLAFLWLLCPSAEVKMENGD